MDRFAVRDMLKRMPITEIPLRVTYYTRVSTDSDEQLNSLDNQIMYYENYIKNNPKWTYVPGYVDEGLTGVTTKKRENFNTMIADAKLDKFDLIVTKEISRFARNTLDSLLNTRDLIAHNVGVYFQNDNINTLDEDGELRLTIMAALAQDESRRLSSRVKFGHAQSIKRNVVHGNSLIYGYKKDNKRLVIDESQVDMVRLIFDMYATDTCSLKQLEQILLEKGYKNRNGGRISHVTLSHIIANPKYKGYYCGNKVKVIDMFTKKQQFLPQDQWRMFKDESGEFVPAIVDEDVWDRANRILQRRSADVKGHKNQCNHSNLFTGKLVCSHCHAPFYKKSTGRGITKDDSIWICSSKIKNGKNSCPTYPIYESEVKKILLSVLSGDTSSIEERISKYETIFLSILDDTDYKKEIADIKKEMEQIEKKASKALEHNMNGVISDAAYARLSNECDKKLEQLFQKLVAVENQERVKNDSTGEIRILRESLLQASKDAANGIINNQFVQRYVDGIYATMEDGVMHLNIEFATTGAKIEAVYGGRSGNMVKRMIPVQPFVFIRSLRSTSNHKEEREYFVSFSIA